MNRKTKKYQEVQNRNLPVLGTVFFFIGLLLGTIVINSSSDINTNNIEKYLDKHDEYVLLCKQGQGIIRTKDLSWAKRYQTWEPKCVIRDYSGEIQ